MLPFDDKQDTEYAIKLITEGRPVSLTYPGIVDDRINDISGFLFRLLSRYDLGYTVDLILFLLREIFTNSSHANAKRLFFTYKNKNINDPDSYKSTMPLYKDEVLNRWDTFVTENENSVYYIKLTIKAENKTFTFTVENNSEIIYSEMMRIEDRIKSYNNYRNLNDAFAKISDVSEGAGCGIVIMLILLKNMGIRKDHLKIKSGDGITRTSLQIPFEIRQEDSILLLKKGILEETESLPSLPQNISNLIEMCANSALPIEKISAGIEHDPGLAAQVLKVANSGIFITRKKNPGLFDAVKILGLKNLSHLLMITGAQNLLSQKYRESDILPIWENSNRVAFYTRILTDRSYSYREVAPTAGLLHAMGRIVLKAREPLFMNKISTMMRDGRARNESVLQEVTLGISHAEIGALLAEKWNFSAPLIHAIRYQERPYLSQKPYRDLTEIVYLSIMLESARLNRAHYYSVESSILKKFGIHSREDFQNKITQLDELYRAENIS